MEATVNTVLITRDDVYSSPDTCPPQYPSLIDSRSDYSPIDYSPRDFPIDYSPSYKWERTSIPQFIISLLYVGFTKMILKPYELVLKSWFVTIIPVFIKKFEGLLVYSCRIEYDIIVYNLTTNLPIGVRKPHPKYGKMKLGRISIGAVIEGLRERFTWMIERETPKYYIAHPEYLPYWEVFIAKCASFLDVIKEFETSWIKVIDDAHKIQREAYYN